MTVLSTFLTDGFCLSSPGPSSLLSLGFKPQLVEDGLVFIAPGLASFFCKGSILGFLSPAVSVNNFSALH